MPGFDGTGPMGAGPMTGGERGFCNPAYTGEGPRYGRGFGGRAFYPALGRGYAPAYGPYNMNPQDEAGMLREEAEYIKQELDAVPSS